MGDGRGENACKAFSKDLIVCAIYGLGPQEPSKSPLRDPQPPKGGLPSCEQIDGKAPFRGLGAFLDTCPFNAFYTINIDCLFKKALPLCHSNSN